MMYRTNTRARLSKAVAKIRERTRAMPWPIAPLLCALVLVAPWAVGSAAAAQGESPSKTIAMIGAGNMGSALGKLWAAAGYHVIYATRHPGELDHLVETTGHGAEAASVGEAVERADIVAMAVPYKAEPAIAEAHGNAMKGKVMLNMDNPIRARDGDIVDKADEVGHAIYSARRFEGTRFIRAFNIVPATSLPEPGELDSADFEVPWTTNDESLRPLAEHLIRAAGGTPVYRGGLENAPEYSP